MKQTCGNCQHVARREADRVGYGQWLECDNWIGESLGDEVQSDTPACPYWEGSKS